MTDILDLLMPFQREGVEFLWPVNSVLVGDEMGLGKTYTGIALDIIRRSKRTGMKDKTLVVAPLGVVHNWVTHYRQLAPELAVVQCDPKNRVSFVEKVAKNDGDVFVCHWEALRLLVKEQDFARAMFFHIIGDEIHRIKNRKAQQTRAFKQIKAVYETGLSGTPADNRPQDLWSILNWLYPRVYTSYWSFYKEHIDYEIQYPHGYHKMLGVKNVDKLREQMKPFYIRRLKKDVLKDLPDKYYTDHWVELTSQQRRAYDQMRKDMLAWVGEHEDQAVPAPVAIAQLVRLQQFAAGYVQVSQSEDRKTGEPINVYRMAEPSSKLDVLMQILEDNPDEPLVVFSQFKQLINLLATRLQAASLPFGLITGDVKEQDRAIAVEKFQHGELQVCAGTIAAGGVGITLTRASTVVFLDRAWSPALNLQAEDRLHRIGQKNAVNVIDIMARNTVDLGRRQQIQLKWQWLRAILGDKVEGVQAFGNTDPLVNEAMSDALNIFGGM